MFTAFTQHLSLPFICFPGFGVFPLEEGVQEFSCASGVGKSQSFAI